MKKAPLQNEKEFLIDQTEQAKQAMKQAAEELQGNLCKLLNLEDWIKKYPWPSLGLGAVAGFAAGYLVIPEKNGKASDLQPQTPISQKIEGEEVHAKVNSLKAALSSGLSALALDVSREFLHQWMHKPQAQETQEQETDITSVPSPS